jgi:hypothetical protein
VSHELLQKVGSSHKAISKTTKPSSFQQGEVGNGWHPFRIPIKNLSIYLIGSYHFNDTHFLLLPSKLLITIDWLAAPPAQSAAVRQNARPSGRGGFTFTPTAESHGFSRG